MSKHNKKTARLLPGVALGLIIISALLFLGCENPVGGVENKPLEQLVGKVYKAEYEGGYTESFSISQDNTGNVILTINDTTGKIIESKTTNEGTVYLLECSNHSNWEKYQYPGYNEQNPHEGCYTLLYIRSSSTKSIEWATFYKTIDTKPTACFASSSKEKAKEYLDLNKWDSKMTSTGIAQN